MNSEAKFPSDLIFGQTLFQNGLVHPLQVKLSCIRQVLHVLYEKLICIWKELCTLFFKDLLEFIDSQVFNESLNKVPNRSDQLFSFLTFWKVWLVKGKLHPIPFKVDSLCEVDNVFELLVLLDHGD